MDLDRKWTLAPATRPIPYCTEVTHIYKRTSAVDSQTISPGDVLYSFLKSMHLDLTDRQLRLKYFFLFCCTVQFYLLKILPQCLEVKFIADRSIYIPYFNVNVTQTTHELLWISLLQ